MLQQMVQFFVSGFVFPKITWIGLVFGIGLGLVFGAVWLIGYRPPIFRKPWLWAVLAGSALFCWTAIAFVQLPLQAWAGQVLTHFWSMETIKSWLLLAGTSNPPERSCSGGC